MDKRENCRLIQCSSESTNYTTAGTHPFISVMWRLFEWMINEKQISLVSITSDHPTCWLRFNKMKFNTKEKNWGPYSPNKYQSLLIYFSFKVSSSLRFRTCALETAFGQMHTSLAWASLYPIDWRWVCHWIRIKVLRLSIKEGRARGETCQRFVCCHWLVKVLRCCCRIARDPFLFPASKSLEDQTALSKK